MTATPLTDGERFTLDAMGFVVLRGVLAPAEVAGLERAFAAARAVWEADPARLGTREAGQSQIQSIIEYDDAFVELMEQPRLLGAMRHLIGWDLQLLDGDGHVKRPRTPAHTRWHRDEALWGVHHPGSTMMAKAIVFLTSVGPSDGAVGFVPGTHHLASTYPFPRVERPEEMPGLVRATCDAGDVLVFHGHGFHTSLANQSDRERRIVAYNFGHFYMKPWGGNEPSATLRARAHTKLRRQLLGIGDPYTQYLRDEDW